MSIITAEMVHGQAVDEAWASNPEVWTKRYTIPADRFSSLDIPKRMCSRSEPFMTLDEFFYNYEQSRAIFDVLCQMINRIGTPEIRVSKSQVVFMRRKAAARVWIPSRYLRGVLAPLVLTLGFNYRSESPRWKEIITPTPGHFTHHLELWSIDDIDGQVQEWLQQAWQQAG